MHILHKILVHLPSDVPLVEEQSREDYLKRIRRYAEEETDEFFGTVFDGRETDSAGGWSKEYPENVLLGSENGKRLLRELQKAQEDQAREIRLYMEQVIEDFGNRLALVVSEIQKGFTACPAKASQAAFSLKRMAKLLDGEYFYDSCFYNTVEGNAKITDFTIAEVRRKPEDWALVFFDYHF